LSFGINVNFHHYSYDRSNFQLIDPDPLLEKGTTTTAIGAGLGIIYSPITDLCLGISLDNLNQPDISLEGNKARKPLAVNLGICYRFFNLVPEFDIKHFRTSQRTETYYVFGLRQLLLQNSANLFAQYQQDCFSVGAVYSFKNFRLDYNYAYPLNELQEISDGSHQFTLSYNFDGYSGYPSTPEISLLSPENTEVDSNSFRFQSLVDDKRGLKQITIQLNGEDITIYNYKQKEKAISVDVPVFPLKEGENRIKIFADNDVKKSTKEIKVIYKALDKVLVIDSSPKIEILTQLSEETKSSTLRLRLSAEFVLDLKDIQVKVNDKKIKLRGMRPLSKKKNKFDIEAELDLEEGMHDVEVIAFNKRGSDSKKRSIRYNPIKKSLYNQLWGVVIGIDNYKDKDVDDLKYAVHDARSVEQLLKEHFSFDHVLTYYNRNATKENIIRAISASIKQVKKEDGVFIFFCWSRDYRRRRT